MIHLSIPLIITLKSMRSLADLDVGNLVSHYESHVGCEGVGCQEGKVLWSVKDRIVLGLFYLRHELGIDCCLGLLEDHLSLYLCHLEIVLFLLYHLLELDYLDFQVGLCFDHLLSLLGVFLFNSHLLLLSSNEKIYLQLLHFLEVSFDSIRYLWLGDSDREDFYSWRPGLQVFIERRDECFVEFVEDVDVDLLERVFGAKLVDLVMKLVSNPELFVLFRVVEDCLIDMLLF